jgi:endogenous inhibitor of DNA gyrase (YacG/DUF329 family)
MPSGIPGSYKSYNCLYCGKENKWGNSKINKFCDNKCQGLFKWQHETIPKIELGIGRSDPATYKKYLLETRGANCSECGQDSVWNKKPLMLQLDHIDGDSDNNSLSNLRLLCPNCHTQTENFGSKGKGSRYKKDTTRNRYLQEYKAR